MPPTGEEGAPDFLLLICSVPTVGLYVTQPFCAVSFLPVSPGAFTFLFERGKMGKQTRSRTQPQSLRQRIYAYIGIDLWICGHPQTNPWQRAMGTGRKQPKCLLLLRSTPCRTTPAPQAGSVCLLQGRMLVCNSWTLGS